MVDMNGNNYKYIGCIKGDFSEMDYLIKSFENKSVKIKTYQAVKFDGTKVKYLQAEDTPSLIKQLQSV